MDVTIDGKSAKPLWVYHLRSIGLADLEAGAQLTLPRAVISAEAQRAGLRFADYLKQYHVEVYCDEPFTAFVLALRRRNHEGKMDVTTEPV